MVNALSSHGVGSKNQPQAAALASASASVQMVWPAERSGRCFARFPQSSFRIVPRPRFLVRSALLVLPNRSRENVSLASFLLSPLTSSVMALVVSPGGVVLARLGGTERHLHGLVGGGAAGPVGALAWRQGPHRPLLSPRLHRQTLIRSWLQVIPLVQQRREGSSSGVRGNHRVSPRCAGRRKIGHPPRRR